MDKKHQVLELLLEKKNQNGYLTLDQLLDYTEDRNLDLLECNWVTDQIARRHIVLLDKEPDSISIRRDDDSEDLAHVDYEKIYQCVLELDPGLKSLVEAVKKIRPPQKGEFMELRDHLLERNRFARKRLIEMYMRAVIKIALNTSRTFDLDIADSIQDGFIGLVNSVDSVSDESSPVFQRNTNWMIYNSIIRGQYLKGANFRIPVHLKEKLKPTLKRLDEIQCFECESFGSCLKCEEIILEMNEGDKSFLDIFCNVFYPLYSIEDILGRDLEEDNIIGITDNEKESLVYTSDNTVIKKILTDDFRSFLEIKLQPRELTVITKRFGLDGNGTHTLEEVGKEFNLTRERIRQIESMALKKLRRQRRKIVF